MKYNNVAIIPEPGLDGMSYPVRRIGLALGFGSKGGNLSHHINGKYRKIFRKNLHYTVRSHRMIYMPIGPLLTLLGLVSHDEPKYAAAVLRFLPKLLAYHKEIA